MIKKGILRLFGYVEHKDDIDWIKRYTMIEVEGTKPTGSLRKMWRHSIKEDINNVVCSGYGMV